MYFALLLVDAICVITVVLLSFRHLSFLHPLSAYLFFHVYSFSIRAWEVYLGAPTMYSIGYSSKYEPITTDEIQRAVALADMALVGFAFGCHLARHALYQGELSGRLSPWKTYQKEITTGILTISIAIGTVFFVLIRGKQANLDFGGLANYAGVATMWPIAGMIALYFITGRFWLLAIPSAVYLSVVAIQGYHRFMLVLPVISLLGVFLYYRRRKWPPIHLWIVIVVMALIFPSLKSIGRAVTEGDYSYAVERVSDALTLQAGPELEESSAGFLDQFAGFLTLCDNYGKWEYGLTYSRILTLPIPRAWWPEKPGLADHLIDRSTEARPYGREGRITTYLGQAYVNFGLVGIICVPFVLAYMLGVFYERFVRLPPTSLAALTYIFLAATFLQAFRDGLTSVLLFGLVFNMPLIFVWVANLGTPSRPFVSKMQKPLR